MMAWLRRMLGQPDEPTPDSGRAEVIEREQARLVARLELLQIHVDVSASREMRTTERGGGDDRETAGR